jgi:hypothetical protein
LKCSSWGGCQWQKKGEGDREVLVIQRYLGFIHKRRGRSGTGKESELRGNDIRNISEEGIEGWRIRDDGMLLKMGFGKDINPSVDHHRRLIEEGGALRGTTR